MITRKIVLWALVLVYLFSNVNIAYAQFWRKWFQKDQQQEQPVAEEQDQSMESGTIKEDFMAQESSEYVEEEGGMRVETWTVSESEEAAGQAAREDQTVPWVVSETLTITPVTGMDEKQREEDIRRTQEHVDQIKKIQEINNMQRSLDNIRRINEMNQQQKRIDELNKLNRMQKNLDELRRMSETKK